MDSATRGRACFCNHCRKELDRRQLNHRFLCGDCATIPGVQGYRDPRKRGLESGSAEYWKAYEHSLNIVRDEWPSGVGQAAAPTEGAARGDSKRGRASYLREWQVGMLAEPNLDADVKVVLIRLSLFADWKTGANCWPSHKTLALGVGHTVKQVRNLLTAAERSGWIAVKPRQQKGRGRTTNLYELRKPEASAKPAELSVGAVKAPADE